MDMRSFRNMLKTSDIPQRADRFCGFPKTSQHFMWQPQDFKYQFFHGLGLSTAHEVSELEET